MACSVISDKTHPIGIIACNIHNLGHKTSFIGVISEFKEQEEKISFMLGKSVVEMVKPPQVPVWLKDGQRVELDLASSQIIKR